jgi:hypothetical protein
VKAALVNPALAVHLSQAYQAPVSQAYQALQNHRLVHHHQVIQALPLQVHQVKAALVSQVYPAAHPVLNHPMKRVV